jgi:hypothetical protein
MTITHTVKLQGKQQYEMEYFTFSASETDLPEDLYKELKSVQIWRSLEYIVQRELINLQLQSGHMTIEEAQGRLEYLRQCLGEELQDKLVIHGC